MTKCAIVCVALAVLSACGGESAAGGTGAHAGAPALIELELLTDYGACDGQRALVPASGAVTETFTSTQAETMRAESRDYVAYQVRSGGLSLYVSFAASLSSSFSTDEAASAFKYAYVDFAYQQPPHIGGSVTLLSSSDLLALGDFDRFEVVAGRVEWRLAWTARAYRKQLSLYDDDPTNDPKGDPGDCVTGDVGGNCTCEFSGPPTDVTLGGSFAR